MSYVSEAFEKLYKRAPDGVLFTPYRVCPLGAHVDHNLGKISGFAINKGIHIAYGPKMNGVVEISSLQFEGRAQWHINSVPDVKQNDWADHLRGATIALSKRYPLRVGICAIVDGELPIGGLSSSAAVIISFLSALCRLNGVSLNAEELISLAKSAENHYVGVACGRLDQSCEVYCRKDNLLYMDFKDNSFELIEKNPNCKPFKIAVFFSGLERSLAASGFNMRVDEARSAAYSILAYAGLEYGKFEETNLRDVPFEVFEQYKDRLPVNFAKRATHFYSECQRVENGVKAWKNGDMDLFGSLIFESGRSSIENWETGSPELIKLYSIMTKTDGIYGGRFSGAGFKGCTMAMINPDKAEDILEKVEAEYISAFPHLKGKYSAYICDTDNGVKL